jgi:hypothetical protein
MRNHKAYLNYQASYYNVLNYNDGTSVSSYLAKTIIGHKRNEDCVLIFLKKKKAKHCLQCHTQGN